MTYKSLKGGIMVIKQLKLKLGTKILCLVFVIVLLFSVSIGTVMLKEITDSMKQMATEKRKAIWL